MTRHWRCNDNERESMPNNSDQSINRRQSRSIMSKDMHNSRPHPPNSGL